jgi:hypothetical protein
MSLQDFPDELLLLIFKPFADYQDHDDPSECTNTPSEEAKLNLKSLASVSKVCVKWHNIVEPIFYSTFRKPASTRPEGPIFLPRQNDQARVAPVTVWRHQNNHAHIALGSIFPPGQPIFPPSQSIFPPVQPIFPAGQFIFLQGQDGYIRVAQPNQTLKLFLQTIIERPHLAESIKKLVLGSWEDRVRSDPESRQHQIKASQPEPSLSHTYRKALRRLTLLERSSSVKVFIAGVLSGFEGSELILLLQLTPNLVKLHVAQIPLIGEWVFNGEHGLASHISTIRLGSLDRMHAIQLSRLSVLMKLPSLRNLTFINCTIRGDHQLPHANLSHLGIQRCRIGLIAFGSLVQQISNLESFEWIGLPYQEYHLLGGWIQHHDALIQRMLAFVDRQRPTLRSLRILGNGFYPVRRELLSFADSDMLEKLTVHGNLICLADRLPQSLVYLRIDECNSGWMKKLVTLISGRALPKLQKIEYSHAPLEMLSREYRVPFEQAVIELGNVRLKE